MITALNTIKVLPSDKQEGEEFTRMLISDIKVCNSPLPVLVQLKVLEKVIKEVLTNDELDALYLLQFKEYAEDNKLEVSGAKLTSQEFGGTYDFSQDKEWSTLQEMIKNLTEKKILRQEELKAKLVKESGKVKVVVKL